MIFQYYFMKRNGIRIIFIGLILLLSSSNINACSVTAYYSTADDGWGTFSTVLSACNLIQYQTDGSSYHAYITFYTSEPGSAGSDCKKIYGTGSTLNNYQDATPSWICCGESAYGSISRTGGCVGAGVYNGGLVQVTLTVSQTSLNQYTISGSLSCTDYVDLYIKNNTNQYVIVGRNNTGTTYSFNILENSEYKLIFSNGYEHEFICNGDIIYNYDGCGYTTINIQDECANLLNGAYTVIYDIDKNMDVVYSGYNNPITIPSSQVNENDELRVIWSTWHGLVSKTCYAQFDHDINLYDPFVYWNMDVYVYDNESNPIEDANVDFNQDCVINGYPSRNKYTDYDGFAEFTECENKDANLVISKDGYQTLSTSVSGGWYDAYTNTYEISVTLQPNNTSTWDLINNSINDTNATEEPQDIPDANGTPINVHLYFKNCNGQYTTQINDSDPYVRCYYDVISMKPVSMTLSFQSSLSGYWFTDVYTYPYTIDNNSYGYMNLSNDNFSDPDYMYRAYIHDPSYPEYNRYVYLSVVNQTLEQETHYENLTALCMFANTNNNGSIDYREEIKGYAYVVSDNASLRNVSLELYDNSTLIDYVNLTNSSFDDDLYEWELKYTYSLNHNYSLVLKGYDGSILDVDNVIAYNIAGNKLTIKVTDAFNHDLDHVYVYVEHYGSINTGWLNYGTFEGLPNGESRYKATKSGYRSGVWKSVNLTNENEIVTYQLIEDAPTGSVASVRMSDSDVKDIYYPFMYFLLIIILIGALMNVIN